MKKQFGFTLIELLIVMSVLTVLALFGLLTEERLARESAADSAATEINQITKAVDNFITLYYGGLAGLDGASDPVNLAPNISTLAAPGKAVICNSLRGLGRMCDIPSALLGDLLLMPNGWTGAQTAIANSGKWMIRTQVIGEMGKSYSIHALILSERPFALAGSPIDPTALIPVDINLGGRAVYSTKQLSAGIVGLKDPMVPASLEFQSSRRNFTQAPSLWDWTDTSVTPYYPVNFISAEGQYGALSGLGAAQQNSIYVRRDGTLPMTGDLNLNRVTLATDPTPASLGQSANCGTGGIPPCFAASPGVSVKNGLHLTRFSGSIDMEKDSTFKGNEKAQTNLVKGQNPITLLTVPGTGKLDVGKDLVVNGTTTLEGTTMLAPVSATGAATRQVIVNGSTTIHGGINVWGGGVASGGGSAGAAGIVGDTLESLIAGPGRSANGHGLNMRNAYVWDLDAIRTSPYVATLLSANVIRGSYIVGLPPFDRVAKPACPDSTNAVSKIYLYPHVMFDMEDIAVTAQKYGFEVYAEDQGTSWVVRARGPTGYDLSNFSAVAVVACSYYTP